MKERIYQMTVLRNLEDRSYVLKDALSHKYLRPVLQHWLSLFSSGHLPARQDMDPAQFAVSMPHISLFDWDESKGDFYCRLAGEDVSNSFIKRLKTHTLAELYDEQRASSIRRLWLHAVREKSILFVLSSFENSDSRLNGRRIILPLQDHKTGAVTIMSVSYYDYDAGYHYDKHLNATPDDYKYVFLNFDELTAQAAFD